MTSTADGESWEVLVALDAGQEAAGSTDVVAGFPAETLTCWEGSPLDPSELEVGQRVGFSPLDDAFEASLPLRARADEIRAEC